MQNQTDVTDADGRHTRTAYDGAHHPVLVTRPDGTTQASGYDDDGDLATQTDGLGHTTTYTYDALDRRIGVVDALARSTTSTRDKAGNVVTVVAPAASGTGKVTTTNTYDAANRLVRTAYSDGVTPQVSRTYDGDGQPATMVDGSGTTTYTVDSLHRVTKVTNGAGKVVSYAYDLAGHATSIAYPTTAAGAATGTVTRGYDAAGRLTSVKDWLAKTTTFGYDPDGDWTTTTYPNTVTGTRTYDTADRLTKTSYTAGATALGAYTRTNAGLLATATPSSGATGTNDTYAYTTNGQLQSTTGASATARWVYDGADRTTRLPTGTTLAYDNGDQLTTATPTTGTATTFASDQRGNRTTAKTGTATATVYGWDQENRLTASTTPAGAKTTYGYDGNGLRASKTPPGAPVQPMTWDHVTGTVPLLLTNGTTSYLYGPGDTPLEQVTATTPTWLHGDHLDSTVLITTTTGTVADRYTYTPYGTVTAHTGTTTTALQYAGQYTDTETALIYLRARYYDPTTATFLTLDPATILTRSRYAYAAGNPLYFRDPLGLWGWRETFTTVAIAFAVTATVLTYGAAAPEAALLAGDALTWGSTAIDVGFAANDCAVHPDQVNCVASVMAVGFDGFSIGFADGVMSKAWEQALLPDEIKLRAHRFNSVVFTLNQGIMAGVTDLESVAPMHTALC